MRKTLYILLLTICMHLSLQAQQHYTFHDGTGLGSEWRHIGEPNRAKYRIVDNKLRLYGDIYELKDGRSFTFAGLPLGDKPFEVATKLSLTDAENGDEAGLCLYRSADAFVQCCLNSQDGQRRLKLRLGLLSHRLLLADRPMGMTSELYLRISFDGRKYAFHYSADGQQYHPIETVEHRLLDKEIAGYGDELLVGMYCHSGTTKYNAGYTFGEFGFFDYKEQQ